MDALACESHFLDHLAPIWNALPNRGRFLVDAPLVERARRKGIEAELVDADAIRRSLGQQPPQFNGKPCLVASIGDVKVARRMGYGPFVFLEHGAGQTYGGRPDDANHSSYSGGPDHDDCGLFLVPNQTVADRWQARYPKAQVAIVGCPKIDDLPDQQLDLFLKRPVVAISFHWPAPQSIGWGYSGTCVPEYLSILPALMERFNVIGHQHPNWAQRKYAGPPSRAYAKLGIPFVPDFEDVCRVAAVYVCDNSSTIWEFAATGRPVVLLNSQQWSRKVNYGLRFWDAAHVGINVERPEQLVSAVERALEDAPEQQAAREDALAMVYGIRSGGAKLAAEAIVEWLASRAEVAA